MSRWILRLVGAHLATGDRWTTLPTAFRILGKLDPPKEKQSEWDWKKLLKQLLNCSISFAMWKSQLHPQPHIARRVFCDGLVKLTTLAFRIHSSSMHKLGWSASKHACTLSMNHPTSYFNFSWTVRYLTLRQGLSVCSISPCSLTMTL